MKINLIAVIGKSASGKDTLVNYALKNFPNLNKVIHYTTRPKRAGEVDGVDYYFITKEEMEEKQKSGELLVLTVFKSDWKYAVGIKSFKTDRINIGVFNLEEIKYLYNECKNLFNFRIIQTMAPDEIRLKRSEERLGDIKNLTEEERQEIKRRFEADNKDFSLTNLEAIPYFNLYTHNSLIDLYSLNSMELNNDTSLYLNIYNLGYLSSVIDSFRKEVIYDI